MLFDLFKDINEGVEEYRQASNAVLMDVREVDEFQGGYIPGAVNVPLSELEEMEKAFQAGDRIAEVVSAIPKDAQIFVYCLRGSRAGAATTILKRFGYQRVKNIGGIATYKGKFEKP